MIQKKLEDPSTTALFCEKLIENTLPFFQTLMVDQFGNYLTQKMFEVAKPQNIAQVVASVLHELPSIASNVHGTRAV